MRHRLVGTVAAAVVVLLACACDPAPAGSQVSAAPSTGAGAAAALAKANPPAKTVTLAFAGDVHFTGRTLSLLDDSASAFGPVAETFRGADLAMINLETAVTSRGTPQSKAYTFRAPPKAFDAIRTAGIDVVSVANNHGIDYGRTGFADELAAAQAAGVATVGGGANAGAAYAPFITRVKGVRIGVLAFVQVGETVQQWAATGTRSGMATAVTPDQIRYAAEVVHDVRAKVDVLVVFMHWGQETNPCPIGRQKDTAKAFADAGADIIVGTHAHVLQGEGWLGDTYVAYGLSNFVWYWDGISPDTGVVRVTLTGSDVTGTEFLPAKINSKGVPVPVSGSEAKRIAEKMDDLRQCTGLNSKPPSSIGS